MTLKEIIESVSSDIEILDDFTKKSFLVNANIDYVSFKIGSHYYLASKYKWYAINEKSNDGSDLTPPVAYSRARFVEELEKLVAKYGNLRKGVNN